MQLYGCEASVASVTGTFPLTGCLNPHHLNSELCFLMLKEQAWLLAPTADIASVYRSANAPSLQQSVSEVAMHTVFEIDNRSEENLTLFKTEHQSWSFITAAHDGGLQAQQMCF